jgi:ADP-ribose pyrophosphatase
MEKTVPVITKDKVKTVFDNKYVKVFDLQYEEGKHYLDATRRPLDELTAIKSDKELKEMFPDAVSCVVILNIKNKEPLLCLTREYRFPAGRFLLSVPAGLIDKEDIEKGNPLLITAEREICEETGIKIESSDKMTIISPLLFSTPGMTDESNAVVQVVLNRDSMPKMSQDGAEGTECFDGFIMMNKEEALKTLKAGSDNNGIYFSTYTWIALMTFVSGLWQ